MAADMAPLRPSRPVERIPNETRVTVDLAPQLGLVLPGVVEGVTYVPGEFLYLINIGLDGMRLTNVPAGRIHREEEGA